MYVPIYTTVINKTTMYSDIVLPLKDIGDNLKLISINNAVIYLYQQKIELKRKIFLFVKSYCRFNNLYYSFFIQKKLTISS